MSPETKELFERSYYAFLMIGSFGIGIVSLIIILSLKEKFQRRKKKDVYRKFSQENNPGRMRKILSNGIVAPEEKV